MCGATSLRKQNLLFYLFSVALMRDKVVRQATVLRCLITLWPGHMAGYQNGLSSKISMICNLNLVVSVSAICPGKPWPLIMF